MSSAPTPRATSSAGCAIAGSGFARFSMRRRLSRRMMLRSGSSWSRGVGESRDAAMCSDVRSRSVAISDALHGAACRVAEWKRARFEPTDRRLRDAVGARDIGLRSAVAKALDGLAPLVLCQDSGAPEFHTVGL